MKCKSIPLLLLAALSGAGALAGEKGGNGGGGEVEFIAIRSEIANWIQARLGDGTLSDKLDLSSAGLTADRFKSVFNQYNNTPVIFQDSPIALAGSSSGPAGRICGNSSDPAQIICNNANWESASSQIRYSIVLHEILGIAGIEKNCGQYSQYPISKNLLSYVERSDKAELGAVQNLATELRERYAGAQIPTKAELAGKWFRCSSYSATLDFNFPVGDQKFTFQILPDSAQHSDAAGLTISEPDRRIDGMALETWAPNDFPQDWRGQQKTEMPGMVVSGAIRREESTGKYLFEYSVENPELQYGVPYLTPISFVYSYNVKVWDYWICDGSSTKPN